MARRRFTVKSDGNGGLDVNVQKDILRRWGPLGLVIFTLLLGLGSRFGDEAWNWVVGHKATEAQVYQNTSSIDKLSDEFHEHVVEVRRELGMIQQTQTRILELMVEDHSTTRPGSGEGGK